jgi:hypothetical protein
LSAHALIPHPDYPCEAVRSIGAGVRLDYGSLLTVSWALQGDLSGLVLPPLAETPSRADGLWKTTCFEVFVRPGPRGAAYAEFNNAPSGDWAAYAFTGYREGMSNLPGLPQAGWECRSTGDGFYFDAILDLGGFPRAPFRLGITAVIEETNGRKSYWALAHPPGAPDFHHVDGFVLELAPV